MRVSRAVPRCPGLSPGVPFERLPGPVSPPAVLPCAAGSSPTREPPASFRSAEAAPRGCKRIPRIHEGSAALREPEGKRPVRLPAACSAGAWREPPGDSGRAQERPPPRSVMWLHTHEGCVSHSPNWKSTSGDT